MVLFKEKMLKCLKWVGGVLRRILKCDYPLKRRCLQTYNHLNNKNLGFV